MRFETTRWNLRRKWLTAGGALVAFAPGIFSVPRAFLASAEERPVIELETTPAEFAATMRRISEAKPRSCEPPANAWPSAGKNWPSSI